MTSMVFREPTAAIGASSSTIAKKPEMLLLTTAEDGSAKMWTIKRGVADTLQSGPGTCLPLSAKPSSARIGSNDDKHFTNSNFFPEPFFGRVCGLMILQS